MAKKKPSFPNRPCPKCGDPIHIKSKKHEKCGWVADTNAAAKKAPIALNTQSKADAVRAVLTKHPGTPAKEVVSTLAGQGIQVSENYVYMLKSSSKSKAAKPAAPRATRPQPTAASSAGAASPFDLIRDVKKLAERAGGLDTLKDLVDVLAE